MIQRIVTDFRDTRMVRLSDGKEYVIGKDERWRNERDHLRLGDLAYSWKANDLINSGKYVLLKNRRKR
jgi:hypothetical protein